MKAAFLFIDLQNDFLNREQLLPNKYIVVQKNSELLSYARSIQAPVIHIHTIIDPEVGNQMPHWKKNNVKQCVIKTDGCLPPNQLMPLHNEIVIQKQFYSGFESIDLHAYLKKHNITRLIISGTYTHACVRSTALDAYALGYDVAIASDAVGSPEPLHAEITRNYLEKREIKFLSHSEIFESVEPSISKNPDTSIKAKLDSHSFIQVNPANFHQKLHEFEFQNKFEIDKAIKNLQQPSQYWQSIDVAARAKIINNLCDQLSSNSLFWINKIVEEVGKPIKDAREEFQRAIQNIKAASEIALSDHESTTKYSVIYRPVGTFAIITPWNNPVAIPIGKIIPALLYGNAVAWKPSPAATRIATLLLAAFEKAGIPEGLVSLIFGDNHTAQNLMRHNGIVGVSITGSFEAGRTAEAICKATNKRVQAELGGNNAAIVLPGDNWKAALAHLVRAAFGYSGQRCTALRRFVVDKTIAPEFIAEFQKEIAKLQVGQPKNENTDIGPLISKSAHSSLIESIESALEEGAELISGGKSMEFSQNGYWLTPTILKVNDASLSVAQTETFGPLAIVQVASDVQHALEIANSVDQGLIAYVIGGTQEQVDMLRNSLQVGILNLNNKTMALDFHAPFMGWKASSIGLPEHGRWDRDFYSNVQVIYHNI